MDSAARFLYLEISLFHLDISLFAYIYFFTVKSCTIKKTSFIESMIVCRALLTLSAAREHTVSDPRRDQ